MFWALLVYSFLLLGFSSSVAEAYISEASIHVVSETTDVTFRSRVQPIVDHTLVPTLEGGQDYVAHLQLIPENLQLCPQEPIYDPVTKKPIPKVWNVTVPHDGVPGESVRIHFFLSKIMISNDMIRCLGRFLILNRLTYVCTFSHY